MFASSTPKNKSFEELVLDKMKGPQQKAYVKRKKIDRKTKVITRDEYLEELKQMEHGEKEKTQVKKKGTQSKRAKKRIAFDDSSEEESDIDRNDREQSEERSEDEEEVQYGGQQHEETDENQLIRLWKSLNPPTSEEDVVQKLFFVASVVKAFLFKEELH